MHSLRRAAFQSVFSLSRSAGTRCQVASLAAHSGRITQAGKPFPAPSTRLFSQTLGSFNDAEGRSDKTSAEKPISPVDEAVATGGDDVSRPGDVHSLNGNNATGSQLRPGETPYGVFIRNIVFEANEDDLQLMYEKYGEITKTVIVRDARGLSRGYGFVFFKDQVGMNTAAAETNGTFWHGRRLQVAPRIRTGRKAQGPEPSEPTSSLYIGNIPYETTDAELNRIFRELDNVTDVRVAVDRTTGWPRGFAHADFSDIDSAIRAMKKLRGTTIGGRELRIDYTTDYKTRRQQK